MNESWSPIGTNEIGIRNDEFLHQPIYPHRFQYKGAGTHDHTGVTKPIVGLPGWNRTRKFHKGVIRWGTEDHVHTLLSLPATLAVAKAVQLIKGGSSKWVHDAYVDLRQFAWQEGYGAFSVNVSLIEETIRYIERQAEHHRRKTFQEEYIEFLKRHGIEYDERYVWG